MAVAKPLVVTHEYPPLRNFGWAIVELFGHTVIAGRVDECMVGNTVGIRVISPVGDAGEEWVAMYHANAVFGLSFCDKETAERAAKSNSPRLWREFAEWPRQYEIDMAAREAMARAR